MVCRDCAAKNQDHTVSEKERNKRIRLAKAHLEEIADLPEFRAEVEEAEKENTLETFERLEQKLAQELFDKLVEYKGGNSAATVYKTLKKLADEAIEEDTMDGYYNLLKGFRKKYDELVKLKNTEEGADKFLEQLTNVVHDRE
ncbi:1175_t:CDS:2 [Paraglomus brasilianum]|uniref:1175_t:CDS:1 n=1 Tax=Paraglomus brasilianum TaxID=144538 RepID=A0A9N9AXM9_9GLOM|nr:1175_t:CDS:2 [Paraglomus brasilianum]